MTDRLFARLGAHVRSINDGEGYWWHWLLLYLFPQYWRSAFKTWREKGEGRWMFHPVTVAAMVTWRDMEEQAFPSKDGGRRVLWFALGYAAVYTLIVVTVTANAVGVI